MGTASEDLLTASNNFMNTMFNIKNMMQQDKQIENQDNQFYENLAWQKIQNEENMNFLREQNAAQIDFANRELNDNIRIANENLALQHQTQEWNKNLAQNVFDYQKQLNATTMEREDNAIQRQVADFKAAGFSPLAAIGGNGSGTASLSSANPSGVDAPQMDMSGINAAAGQYADFAREYANLAFTAKQDYINRRTELAQRHNSEITGAKLALQQLKSDNYYKGQSASLNFFNALVNRKNQNLQNEYLEEQIDYLKDKHNWENDRGYRAESPVQALTNAVLNYINSKKESGETTLEGAFDLSADAAKFVKDTIITSAAEIPVSIAHKVQESNLTKTQKTALTFYIAAVSTKIATSKMAKGVKAIYYLGETIYRNLKGYKD